MTIFRISMPHILHGNSYTNNLFVVYLKFKLTGYLVFYQATGKGTY